MWKRRPGKRERRGRNEVKGKKGEEVLKEDALGHLGGSVH